ncbi:unnamed protein product [Clonostachys rosea]|uniref:Carbohydrate kinase PfkB domain-containing protein n=1 Tax=Bionectria ochroleuca TaxID=29856 RepID=A0ABY6UP92_BIOOC|nr:unnamed protein product [Clonostachys rosea]
MRASDSRTVIGHNTLPDMEIHEFKRGRVLELTLAYMRYLRGKWPGTNISIETKIFPREGLQALIPGVGVVLYNKGWALVYTIFFYSKLTSSMNATTCTISIANFEKENGYKDAETCLRAQALICRGVLTWNSYRRLFLCCTWGDQGASTLDVGTGDHFYKLAWTSSSTIGAGDTFIAEMLYSYIAHSRHWSFSKRLQFSNRLAGYKVAQEGFKDLGYFTRRRF